MEKQARKSEKSDDEKKIYARRPSGAVAAAGTGNPGDDRGRRGTLVTANRTPYPTTDLHTHVHRFGFGLMFDP